MAYPAWQQFNNGSSAYLGANQNGLGIPLYMQNAFGGTQDTSQGNAGPSGPQMGSAQTYQPGQGGGTGGGIGDSLNNYRNEQDQKSVDANSSFNVSATGYVPSKAGDVVGKVANAPNTEGGTGSSAPNTGGTTPPANTGSQAPTTPYQAPPAVQPVGGSPAGLGLGASPTATQVTQPYGQSFNSSGQYAGTPVSNSWYNGPNGWTFGNQSAADQFKTQFPGQVPGGAAPPAAPPAATGGGSAPVGGSGNVPTDGSGGSNTSNLYTKDQTPSPSVGDPSTIPEALGGTMKATDFAAGQQAYRDSTAAGFGGGTPTAMGGMGPNTAGQGYAEGGAVRGYAGGGAARYGQNDDDDNSHPMGLVRAARKLASYGQDGDDTLAHISKEERDLLDRLQGGRRTNPHTGLPQYSLLGDILKTVARIGVTVGAGVLSGGNPYVMAAANAAVSKATGSSWKDSLISGALTGVTAGVGNYANGGDYLKSTSFPGITGDVTNSAQAAALPAGTWQAQSALGQGLSQGMNYLGTSAGAAIGLGNAISSFNHPPGASTPPPGWQGGVMPSYDKTNLPSWYTNTPAGKAKAAAQEEDTSSGSSDFNDPMAASRMSMQYANAPQQMAGGGGVGGIGASQQALMNKSDWGYVNAKGGGDIHGPGTGTSDDIPALLSDGEHVTDRQTIDDLGNGDNDLGQKRMEHIKQTIRAKAGRVNPKSPKSPLKHGLSHYAHA